MRGQMSAEMLILIAVVLAVVAIAALQIIGSAKDTSQNIGNQTNSLNRKLGDAVKSQAGDHCIYDSDCMDGLSCDQINHRCI